MKWSSILAVLALVGSTTALIVTCLRGDDLRIERPEWMSAPRPPEPVALAPSRVEIASEASSERTTAVPSAIKEMADAGQLASAIEQTRQTVAFRARALIDAGIAEDVARGMVKVVEEMEPAYHFLVEKNNQTGQRYGCEFLLAIWPDLPDMIRRKEIKLDIAAFPPENWSQPKVGLAMAFEVSRGALSYTMNMERWSVGFEFTTSANPKPELFAKVLEAARPEK